MHRVAATVLRTAASHQPQVQLWRQHSLGRPGVAGWLRRRPSLPARRYTAGPITAIATPFPWKDARPAWVTPVQRPTPGAAIQRRLGSLWEVYLQSLQRKPLLTKAATSFVCCIIGDTIAQMIGGAPYSVARVLRLATYSATVGATTNHFWHRYLDATVHPAHPTSTQAVVKKTLLDQFLLTPVMTAVFFTAVKLMEGRPDAILPFLQDKYISTLVAGWVVWGPWNVISFKLIPQDLRLLAGNIVGLAWGTYISVSCVNSIPTSAACSVASSSATAAQLQPQSVSSNSS